MAIVLMEATKRVVVVHGHVAGAKNIKRVGIASGNSTG